MIVDFTESAQEAYLNALLYIAERNHDAAVQLATRVDKALNNVTMFPEAGRTIPEFSDSRYREMIVPPYRIQYFATGDDILVVGFWHDKQIPEMPEEAL